MLILGIDVGTQGIRAIAVDEEGNVIASFHEYLKPSESAYEGFKEQDPKDWKITFDKCFKKLIDGIKAKNNIPSEIVAIAVDGTSGTVLPLDDNNMPLAKAIMYNDARAREETGTIREISSDFSKKVGYSFNSSFALPKILWIKNRMPEVYKKARKFIHQTDYVVGLLTGVYDITDHTNALKTGFDLIDYRWPEDVFEKLGLDLDKFPKVVRPGEYIAHISKKAAGEYGLDTRTVVVGGLTDGCAGQMASGAVREGAWNTILGTTLVIKGITRNLIKDEQGRIYSHLHPEGYWMPGGASNTGGESLEKVFSGIDYKEWDFKAERYFPTSLIIYPLVRKGERFPFLDPEAEGFLIGKPKDDIELYAGYLEGIGLFERLCYEMLMEMGAQVSNELYVTGGSTRSNIWMKARASILNKTLLKPRVSDPCMGTALVAASKTIYSDVMEAAARMVKPSELISPDKILVKAYEEKYNKFREIMVEKGYITS